MNQNTLPDYDQAQEDLEAALQLIRSRLKLVSVLSAAGVWLAATLLLLLAFVIADHWLPGGIPDVVRGIFRWLYLLAAGLWLMMTVILPLLRKISSKTFS